MVQSTKLLALRLFEVRDTNTTNTDKRNRVCVGGFLCIWIV